MDHPIHEEYRRAWNDYAEQIQRVKAAHWLKWLEEINQSDMWDASRLVTGPASDRGRVQVPPLKVVDAENGHVGEITNNREKSRAFRNAFFPKKPEVSSVPIDPVYPTVKWRFEHITDEQIHRAIRRMKPWKATKPGTVPNAVFVNARELLVPHLGPIFRATFTLGIYPREWAVTETLVLKKPGRPDYGLPGAWRPDSAVGWICQAVECMHYGRCGNDVYAEWDRSQKPLWGETREEYDGCHPLPWQDS